MDVKKWLYSNMFFRNMISDLIGRSTSRRKPGGFTPYFQYKIGPYQSDYYLYFPDEPFTIRYKNEIFNKLNEYQGADIANYLEFHYLTYSDKSDFLKFLIYEINSRLNLKISQQRRLKLKFVQEWVLEKQQIQSAEQAGLKKEIEQEVRGALPAAGIPASGEEAEKLSDILSQKVIDRLEKIMTATEERMLSLTNSFVTGNIELNNQNHIDKLIKLFKLLKDVQAPKELARGEQLFKRFSDADIAAILRLHFKGFNKQLNSIQKSDIKKADESISDKNPKLKKLEEALSDYFYG